MLAGPARATEVQGRTQSRSSIYDETCIWHFNSAAVRRYGDSTDLELLDFEQSRQRVGYLAVKLFGYDFVRNYPPQFGYGKHQLFSDWHFRHQHHSPERYLSAGDNEQQSQHQQFNQHDEPE